MKRKEERWVEEVEQKEKEAKDLKRKSWMKTQVGHIKPLLEEARWAQNTNHISSGRDPIS